MFRHSFSCIATIKLLQHSCWFQIVLLNACFWNAFGNPKKIACENGVTRTTNKNNVRHMKRWSAGSSTFPCLTNSSTESRAEMNCQLAKKHPEATARVVRKCKKCDKNLHSFYLLREHKSKEYGAQRSSSAQKFDMTQLMGDADDNSLKEELETCK